MSHSCPRDGSALVSPEDSGRSTFTRHGIHHCSECSGMLLNADAASSKISERRPVSYTHLTLTTIYSV